MVAYVLGMKDQPNITRNMAFNLTIVLIEAIDDTEKRKKAINIFHVDNVIMKTDKHDVHDSELPTLKNTRKSKRYDIADSSEQNNDNDLLFDNVIW